MSEFVGRSHDLDLLNSHLSRVRAGESRMLSLRGRRQIGKSRLVTEFVTLRQVPQLFVTGSRQASLPADLESFRQDASLNCTLPGRELLTSMTPASWEQALRLVHAALPKDGPSILVLDELPWLLLNDPGFDGTLQKLWDQLFDQLPVLLILIGSDLSVMEMLTDHDRPLFGRAREMVVDPLSVRDVARLAGTDATTPAAAATIFDATLLTGGYPRLVAEWARTPDVTTFLTAQLADENTDLVTTGRRILDAEFPPDLQASTVLRAIGSGERNFSSIASRAGVTATGLTRSLSHLTDKRVVAADHPVSTRPTPKLSRYRIADSYLRFWLRFVEGGIADVQRGRADLAVDRVLAGWSAYRGRAVEPLVRDALNRLSADDSRLGGAELIGGWWPRNNTPEVDIVGVKPAVNPSSVPIIGSIKWRESSPFDDHDLQQLAALRSVVPGAVEARLIGVGRTTCTAGPDAFYSGADLIQAWR